jgi:hypothetical protein
MLTGIRCIQQAAHNREHRHAQHKTRQPEKVCGAPASSVGTEAVAATLIALARIATGMAAASRAIRIHGFTSDKIGEYHRHKPEREKAPNPIAGLRHSDLVAAAVDDISIPCYWGSAGHQHDFSEPTGEKL